MKNTYFVMRHGQSRANAARIILSHCIDGQKEEYTLTERGEDEVRQSALRAKESGILNGRTSVFSSPFSRCIKTADIVEEVLQTGEEPITDERLRERGFGEWEKTSSDNYANVWMEDKINSAHTTKNVESADSVQRRALALIDDLERRYDGRTILLVSHGDVLQILQSGLLKQSASLHRAMPPLRTAEIRKLDTAR